LQTCRGHIERTFDACHAGVIQAQKQCHGVIDALNNVSAYAREIFKKIPRTPKKPDHGSTKWQAGATASEDYNSTLGRQKDICQPLDPDRICDNLNNSDSLCQPTDWAGDAIKLAVHETRIAMKSLRRVIQFNVTSPKLGKLRVTTGAWGTGSPRNASKKHAAASADQSDFRSATAYFEIVTLTLSIVTYVIAGAVLFCASHQYVKNYLCSDCFDNHYVTHRLVDIDLCFAKRPSHRALLPLTKFEQSNVRNASSQVNDRCSMGLTTSVLSLTLSVTTVMFEFALHWILTLVADIGRPSFDVTGRESLEMVVVGEGVIVDFLDVFLKGFHPRSGLNGATDTQVCLPTPHPPSMFVLILLSVIQVTLLSTILLNQPILIARNRVTGYFYPDRERMRSVYLYNSIARRRLRLGELLRAAAMRNYRQREQWERMSTCHSMVGRWTRGSGGGVGSGRCLVCDTDEVGERDNVGALITCDKDGCSAIYCLHCYVSMQRICAICQPDTVTPQLSVRHS